MINCFKNPNRIATMSGALLTSWNFHVVPQTVTVLYRFSKDLVKMSLAFLTDESLQKPDIAEFPDQKEKRV